MIQAKEGESVIRKMGLISGQKLAERASNRGERGDH